MTIYYNGWMDWLYFTLVGIVLGSLSNILRRFIMKDDKSEAYASVVFFQFTGFLIILLICIARGITLPNIAAHPLNYIAQAILWGTSSYCLFKAAKYLEAAEISVITTSASVITIVTAILFLHEVFTPLRFAGTAIIIFAIVLVSSLKGKFKLNKGVLYALGCAVTSGVAVTNDTFLLKSADLYALLVVGWLTPALFLILMQPKVVSKLPHFFAWRKFKSMFAMTLVYSLAGIAFYYAISIGGQASQVNTISQSGIILTTILAAVFLREREHLGKKLLSAVLVILGVLMLR